MSIFDSSRTLSFGPQLATPSQDRPQEAVFLDRRVPRGECFGLTWATDTTALGYHIFRSQSVRHIRDRSMHSLWRGTYADSVTHFTVGPKDSCIVDNYDLRGADFMFYWVLSQDVNGTLRVVEFTTHIADEAFKRQHHLLLEDERTRQIREQNEALAAPPTPASPTPAAAPQAAAPQAAAPQAGPPAPHIPAPTPQAAPVAAAPPKPIRPVTFIPYKAPEIFQVIDRDGAQSYEVYVGPQMPDAALSDTMWDGKLMPGNPMRCYRLPGNLEGFGDRVSPPGSQAYLAIFAVKADGTRTQPSLGIPPEPPHIFAELT